MGLDDVPGLLDVMGAGAVEGGFVGGATKGQADLVLLPLRSAGKTGTFLLPFSLPS